MNLVAVLAIAGVVVLAYFLIEASNMSGLPSGSGSGAAEQIALAIGVAEGGYDANGNNLGNGTAPSVNHNPGDLTVDVNNTSTGTSNGFVVYADDATGYAALVYQVNEWLNGTSANAGPNSTIDDISQFYTTDSPPGAQVDWASNVAAVLGVPSSTPIGQIGQTIVAAATPASSSTDQTSDDTGAVAALTDDTGQADPQTDSEGE